LKVKLIVISTIFILSSCLGTRYLDEGQTILKKQVIKTGNAVKSEELESLKAQKPNTRLLLFPIAHLARMYQVGYKHYDSLGLLAERKSTTDKYDQKIASAESNKKKLSLRSKKTRKIEKLDQRINEGNLRMRWGEKLAVFDSTKLDETKINISEYLFSKGYFDASVETLEISTEDRMTSVKLKINEGPKYLIDSLIYTIENKNVEDLFLTNIKGQSIFHKQYSQNLLSEERDRVFDLMTNNGYYDFKKQYIFFELDTVSLNNHRIIVRESIVIPEDRPPLHTYNIDSVVFTTNPNNSQTANENPKTYNQLTYNFNNNKYYPRVIDWRIFVRPNTIYSKQQMMLTQKQLSYLDMFKFVNIAYDSIDNKFVSQIFTSPLSKYQTSIEGGLSLMSLQNQASGWPGPFVNFNAKNRNTFKGLEILQLNANTSIQGIRNTNTQTSDRRYSRFQFGGDLSITFPQFIFPVSNDLRSKFGKYNPKTKATIGVNFEDRIGEYERTTFNTIFGYSWQINENSRITLNPLDVAFIKTANTSDSFKSDLAELESTGNISYVNAFRSSFISSSNIAIDYNKNNYGLGNKDAFLIHSSLEYGGLAQLLFGDDPLNQNQDTAKTNFSYYQYLKGNIDYRQNIRLNSKTAFAYRMNVGVAYVYGESKSLPYEKYFFTGGSNSIRAWKPRRLGPGSYATYTSETGDYGKPDVNYVREQPGDILIELSAEFRRSFIGIIDYALFVDAGNVWLWKSKTTENKPDPQNDNGTFKFNTFYQEMAVGAGAGLRLDFSFLVFRIDGAYKVFDPARPLGDRFVLNELKFNNLWDKVNFNFGIGYPF
jgi:outer membrane protein insertion porin family